MILRMLAKEPEGRYQSMKEIASELTRLTSETLDTTAPAALRSSTATQLQQQPVEEYGSSSFRNWLSIAADILEKANQRLVFLIDGLDQLEDSGRRRESPRRSASRAPDAEGGDHAVRRSRSPVLALDTG